MTAPIARTTTADAAKPRVAAFCKTLVAGARPALVPIHAADGCQPLDCFNDVRRRVAEAGGRIQFGWTIWEWPRVLIEAEHHAVHDPGDGQPWIDLTPAQDGEIERLFVADDRAPYDFTNPGSRRRNIRKALSSHRTVQEYLALTARDHDIAAGLPGVGTFEITCPLVNELHAIKMTGEPLMFAIGMTHTGRNDPCFCRSGQKIKKCHGVQA